MLRTLSAADVHDDYVASIKDYEITKHTEQRLYNHNSKNIQSFIETTLKSPNDILFGIFY